MVSLRHSQKFSEIQAVRRSITTGISQVVYPLIARVAGTLLYDACPQCELDILHESVDFSLAEDLKTKLEALISCSEAGRREAENTP